ncbi:MAG: hypothetical protein FJX74_11590 [Armatimonadetes bacterium]|nr:hypothetical protein [Armatimonadota bacterium]
MGVLALAALVAGPTHLHAALPLLPLPQEIEERDGSFALSDRVAVSVLPGDDPDLRFAADQAAEELECGRADEGAILIGLPARSPRLAAICRQANCLPDETLGDQGYVLLVTPERVLIAANGGAGAFYGVQTLLQLAQIGGGRQIPGVRIRDWPVLKWRGVLTDQSRQAVPKVETYKRMIRELSRYKLNFVSMHLEHTFVIEKHPLISEGTGALTAAETREICDYARQYHCLFFPSFEAFGHQHHIFKHPEYADLAESDWKYSFAPTVEGTYSLLGDMFDEMCPAFTGTGFFNAGCDEVGDLGAGRSKELADRIGKAALYAQHMNRVHDLLQARGKRMMMWGDMLLQHPEAIHLVPRDTIIMDWHYGPAHDYPSITQFREKGFEVFVVPALSSWCRLFPDYDLALENMEWLIRRGREQGAIGSMTCNWGDDGNENLIANCYYGWLFSGECSWGAQKELIDRSLFDRAFCRQFFGTDSAAPAQAVHLLTQANTALGLDTTFPWRFFHDDPFNGQYRKLWPRGDQWVRLRELAQGAHDALAPARDAPRNADVVEAMSYAARRAWFAAQKAEGLAAACETYQHAWGTGAVASATEARHTLAGLREALIVQRAAFVRHWNAENRPEGIDYNLRRFDAQLAALDDHLARLDAARAAAVLPSPADLDLDDRRLRRGLAPHLALPADWRAGLVPRGATVSIPVEVGAGGHARVDVPVLVDFPMGRLTGEEPYARGPLLPAATLVAGDVTIQAQIALTGGDTDNPTASLAFILPGTLPARGVWRGELHLDWDAQPPAPAPLTEAVEAGVLIHNGPYEALVGAEGAHVFTWKLAKLGGLDVTQPGEADWAGWFDDPRLRRSPFTLRVIAEGPAVGIIRAESEDGYAKEFYFWKDLSYAECVFSDATGMSWAFDSTANFAADSPMPGTAYLSSGFSGPVPAGAEQRQVPEGGAQAWWCCKTRADGLTLGLITPTEQTRMKVGPGGGWGGVGIEGSNPCRYFAVYCDVDPRGPGAVEEAYHTLARDDPITVTFGRPEVRP